MKVKFILLLAVSILATGCDHVVDCLDDDGPVFNQKSVTPPILNQVYQEQISVSIRNEPNDDAYNYDISYSGRLPAGINANSSGRIFEFTGTPTELGSFEIELLVRVSGNVPTHTLLGDDTVGLCFDTRRQKYLLDIQAM